MYKKTDFVFTFAILSFFIGSGLYLLFDIDFLLAIGFILLGASVNLHWSNNPRYVLNFELETLRENFSRSISLLFIVLFVVWIPWVYSHGVVAIGLAHGFLFLSISYLYLANTRDTNWLTKIYRASGNIFVFGTSVGFFALGYLLLLK